MSFDLAVQAILATEGPYHDDPDDPGGPTAWGIALNRHPDLTLAQIQSMTEGEAANIYRAQYWQPICGDLLPDAVGYVLLDCAVNQGTGEAVKILQSALYVPIDGVVGPQTVAAAHSADIKGLISRFSAGRILRYSQSPDWGRFGNGWATRVIQSALNSGVTQT